MSDPSTVPQGLNLWGQTFFSDRLNSSSSVELFGDYGGVTGMLVLFRISASKSWVGLRANFTNVFEVMFLGEILNSSC